MPQLSRMADALMDVGDEVRAISRDASILGLNHAAVSTLAIAGELEGWARYMRYSAAEHDVAVIAELNGKVDQLPF